MVVEPIELEGVELPVDMESSTLVYEWGAFGGATSAAVIENPDVSGNNTSTTVLEINKAAGAPVWAGSALLLNGPIDFSMSTTVTVNVWSPRAGVPILFKIEDPNSEINADGIPSIFAEVSVETTVENSWETLIFDMTDSDIFNVSNMYTNIVLFPDFGSEGLGELFYFDDIMLMSTAQLPSGSELLINGDFENGSDPWIVGVSDDSPVSVITEDDNTFYSVNVETVGDSFAVNMSQKVEIIQGSTYVLTFDAWSDVNRSLIAGIGLSGGDFSSAIETVDITTTMETYELILSASEFGALDARVLFDMGADIGMVNIDNVSLRVIGGNIAVNGAVSYTHLTLPTIYSV